MPSKPSGKPNGRPPVKVKSLGSAKVPEKEIVMDQVLYWIGLQATAQEIASSFHVSTETLDTKLKEEFGIGFLELKKRYDGSGKLSLRRYQFKQSEGNASMAIFLGKQWLGQQDHAKIEATPDQMLLNKAIVDQITLAQQFAKDALELRRSKVQDVESHKE